MQYIFRDIDGHFDIRKRQQQIEFSMHLDGD